MNESVFQVEVTARQFAVYRVQAPDAVTAREIASARWQRNEPSDIAGLEFCEMEAIRTTKVADDEARTQDEEVLLRYVRERERLMLRLSATTPEPSLNDAISASQAAADLGWLRTSANGEMEVDSIRAADALERLCSRRCLACFPRQRVRAGERGEIRLYCTPEYLDRLSATIDSGPRHLRSHREVA